MSSDGSRLDAGLAWIDEAEGMSVAGSITKGFSAMVLASVGLLIAIWDAGAGVITRMLDAFGVGGESIIIAFLESPASFLADSFSQASTALGTGQWAALGPFVPWLAGASVIGFFWMITSYLDRQDSDVPGTGIDLPFIGNESEEEGIDWPFIGNDDEGEGE